MTRSEELLERARRRIPWGTQTNAKRPDESLSGIQPFFIERAEGCRMQDVDGRWYIDYRSSLGPIILGYRHPDVDAAVLDQMGKGVLFSMASPLEIEVAESLCELIPGLDKVRFLKTGNEVNGAAIRLARAFTGRDFILTCGYHGHGDWFACGSGDAPSWFPREGNGVPILLDSLAARIAYGDVEALEQVFREKGDDVAALMLIPYDWNEKVARDFINRARELTEEHGSILIFDQVLTGFRLAKGGAQEYFDVIPDLSTYAKAIANGYPLAAYGGRSDVMDTLEQVLLTSTYAGETLSLAAAKASLKIHREEAVSEHIWSVGARLMDGFDGIAARLGAEAKSYGLPPAPQFRFSEDAEIDEALRHNFFRELYRRGIFAAKPFLMNYAHKAEDVDETLAVMAEALEIAINETTPA